MSLNRYQFIGNLGGDAEVKDFQNGRSVINFSVAVTEKWKDAQGNQQEATTWVRCALWRQTGKTGLAQYLKRGQTVCVEGKPSARAYEQSGESKASLECQVTEVYLIGGGGNRQQQPGEVQFGGAPITQSPQPQTRPAPTAAVPDDDLPF